MVELRVATEEDWPAMHRADGRVFGAVYSEQDQAGIKSVADPSRFRLAVDDGAIVGIAGSYSFDMTMPGGATLPTSGVTWVSVGVSHRRQGLLRRLMGAMHDDARDRDEPLAALTASEGGIYERFGYGVATISRIASLDRHRAEFRPEVPSPSAPVRVVEPLDVLPQLMACWDRYRVTRAGEISRSEAWWRWVIQDVGDSGVWLLHPDGYACWKLEAKWNDGHPAHELHLINLVALTPAARIDLWRAVLSADLVGAIITRRIALDDPLPMLLRDPRAVRTTGLNDGVWCHTLDIARCYGARSAWGTEDDVVVEVEGTRWRLGASGATKKRGRPDLVTDRAALGALLLGGVAPSTLAAGNRLTARSPEALRRADALFLVHPSPHCQTGF